MRSTLRAVLVGFVLAPALRSQEGQPPSAAEEGRRLTVKEALSLERKMRPEVPLLLGWKDDQHWVERRRGKKEDEAQPSIDVVDAATGTREPLFDAAALASAFAAEPGFSDEEARKLSHSVPLAFTKVWDAALWRSHGDLWFWRFGEERVRRLTHDPEEEVGAALSPDGRFVAFLRGNDLWVAPTDGSGERVLVRSSGPDELVGRLDWVYQEEVYGRGNWQGFFWSPDSRRIAYLVLDESPVPAYTIVDHRVGPDRRHPRKVEVWRYPKAGDRNPRVRVGVVDVAGGAPRAVDLDRYAQQEILVVRVGWRPDAAKLLVQVQDRLQTWLDLVEVDPGSGATRVLFRDRTGVWIEPTSTPVWRSDSSQFLWLSERDGFRHLYLYDQDGDLLKRLTKGRFEIDRVFGIDEDRGVAWVMSDRDDVKGSKLFLVPLDGGEMLRVTEQDGTHSVSPSPDFGYFRDTWSSLLDPGWAAVFAGDGKLVRTLAEVDESVLEPYHLPQPRFVTVPNRDGFEMQGLLVEPPPDAPRGPDGRFPVLCYTYSGPHTQQVLDRYRFRARFWHLMLAKEGIGVFLCDNRSASGRGLESVKGIYHHLGREELRDLQDAVAWLLANTDADRERIGIWGWSYGGYMTAYALTHCDTFELGIAGAPVTDWRFYDTIYTERYMGTPQENPDGYEESSVVAAADRLHGALLLIHGTIDENVHLQNSLEFVRALQAAGKSFEFMLYPGNRHGIGDPRQREHLYTLMADFVRRRL